VYCAEVPSGNIIIRRNGKVLVTGNCHNYNEKFLESIEGKYKKLLGLTATPFRDDGFIYGEDKFWNEPCYEFDIKDSIDAGYLCGYEAFATDKSYAAKKSKVKREFTQREVNEIVDEQSDKLEGIIKETLEIVNSRGIKKIAFLTASTKHADEVSLCLRLQNEENVVIHSKIKNANDIAEDWKTNDIRSSVSCMMISEGFDLPVLDCLVLLRPTRSTRLMIQVIGRALRLYEGKEHALVLDYAEVFDNVGTPIMPIYNFQGKKGDDDGEKIKKCRECFFIFETGTICPSCGFDNFVKVDYQEKLKSSIYSSKEESYFFIFQRGNVAHYGKTRNGGDMLKLESQGVTVTLFGKQCSWFNNMAKNDSYIKVFLKKSKCGKYFNMSNMEFSTFREYYRLKQLDQSEINTLFL
jgi:superfamily II DNA or RNA helicase